MDTATSSAPLTGEPAQGPVAGRSYLTSLRDGRPRWWKTLVIIAAGGVVYLIMTILLTMIAFAVDAAIEGISMVELMSRPLVVTPVMFASALLSLVALLPASLLLYRLLFRSMPLGTLFSVEGRFRWGWAGRAFLVAVIVIGAVSALILAVQPRVLITDAGPPANPWPWVAVAVLIMPLQAAAEEITFRGLLGRSLGALFARAGVGAVVGLAVSSVAFGSAHLAGDPWLIFYYLAFGVLMGVVAWLTGGIEAAVVLHVVNNVLMGVIGGFLDRSLESGIDRSLGAGSPLILIHLGTLVITAAALVLLARRTGVATRTPAGQEINGVGRQASAASKA